jgi:hypothetical protein
MFSERGGHHIWSSSTSSQFSARGSWLLLAGHSSQLFSGGSSQFCNSNLRPLSNKSPQRSPPKVRAHCDPGASSGKGLGRTTPQGGPFEGDWGAERPRGMLGGGFRALCAPEGAWGAWGALRPKELVGGGRGALRAPGTSLGCPCLGRSRRKVLGEGLRRPWGCAGVDSLGWACAPGGPSESGMAWLCTPAESLSEGLGRSKP